MLSAVREGIKAAVAQLPCDMRVCQPNGSSWESRHVHSPDCVDLGSGHACLHNPRPGQAGHPRHDLPTDAGANPEPWLGGADHRPEHLCPLRPPVQQCVRLVVNPSGRVCADARWPVLGSSMQRAALHSSRLTGTTIAILLRLSAGSLAYARSDLHDLGDLGDLATWGNVVAKIWMVILLCGVSGCQSEARPTQLRGYSNRAWTRAPLHYSRATSRRFANTS
ncbi:hypothetical protein MES5069_10004 [Mesorhizobium escarrei]|uniref:Uncharacterized protein n=1 Tax=Mesorhizobium escarrei TaxID=666018 RepID=A0ABN8JG16_9HYPH|nr:hypothetical protein MES5069_10004 [Mesorhizobium escarrei]